MNTEMEITKLQGLVENLQRRVTKLERESNTEGVNGRLAFFKGALKANNDRRR